MPDIAHAARTCAVPASRPAEVPPLPADLAAAAANDARPGDPQPCRQRMPTLGPSVTESGTPSLSAWASALTLGDLEACLRKAVA